jgi:hypothetical protein
MPGDDFQWWAVRPVVDCFAGNRWVLGLTGAAKSVVYDDGVTDEGDDLSLYVMTARPRVTVMLLRGLSLSLEPCVEWSVSNDDDEEYSGVGVDLKLRFSRSKRLRCGIWAGTDQFVYTARTTDTGESQEDTGVSAGVWGSWRLRPEYEIVGQAEWGTVTSNAPDAECETWSATLGVRVVYEWLLD